jgi:hypothetical protein
MAERNRNYRQNRVGRTPSHTICSSPTGDHDEKLDSRSHGLCEGRSAGAPMRRTTPRSRCQPRRRNTPSCATWDHPAFVALVVGSKSGRRAPFLAFRFSAVAYPPLSFCRAPGTRLRCRDLLAAGRAMPRQWCRYRKGYGVVVIGTATCRLLLQQRREPGCFRQKPRHPG